MRSRRTAALLAFAAMVLAGCGSTAADDPQAGATTPAPDVTSTDPTPNPTTPTPTPSSSEPAAPAALCEELYATAQEAKAMNPDPALLESALIDAGEVPAELAASVKHVTDQARDYAAELTSTEAAVDPLELEVPQDLVGACAASDVDLGDISLPEATVEEVCFELHQIAGWQDPRESDLQEIVDFFADRARTYTPPEIEEGVHAYADRLQPAYADPSEESPEQEAARLALGETCEAEGLPLLQP